MTSPPSSMRHVIGSVIVATAACITSACGSSAPQQTATAAHDVALSSLETLRATSTVAHARLQTTLDYAGTRVVQADAAGTFLASNLIGLGTEAAYIVDSLRLSEQLATADANVTGADQNAGSVVARSREATAAANTIVTPPGHTPAPTSARGGPRLEDVAMASGVRADDCAIDVNPRFTPASTAIYVVARAYSIPAGATISSSWRRSGAEVVSFSFDRAHPIHDNCIWFFIDQTDTPFTVGAWSVEIFVDGAPLASPVAFQIVGN